MSKKNKKVKDSFYTGEFGNEGMVRNSNDGHSKSGRQMGFFVDEEDSFDTPKPKSISKYDDYDDYYGSYYGGGSSYYGGARIIRPAYSYNTFNWSKWSLDVDETSNDKPEDFVKPYEGYLTPSDNKIVSKSAYKLRRSDDKLLDVTRNLSKFFYARILDDKEYISELYEDEEKLDDNQKQIKSFYDGVMDGLWDKFVPGDSPLEKALFVVNNLKDKEKPSLPFNYTAQDEKNTLDFKIDEEIYFDSDLNELIDLNDFTKKNKTSILDKLSLIKNLDSNFKVEKEISEKFVQNSSIITQKIMRDYSDIFKADLYQRALPNFNYKFATKSMTINQPVDRAEKKQKIIMLVDYSGSMNQDNKQQWVCAFILDRLKYVIKEECEIIFSYFLTLGNMDRTFKFHHIVDKPSAIKFWRQFSTQPNGGDTELGLIVDAIGQEIAENGEFERFFNIKGLDITKDRPEILAIADGQDSVKSKKFNYKTNAISLIDRSNEELKKLCLHNKGTYVYIDVKDNVTSYNGANTTHKNLEDVNDDGYW